MVQGDAPEVSGLPGHHMLNTGRSAKGLSERQIGSRVNDNNWWTYEWACNQESGAASSSWWERGDNWWSRSERSRDDVQHEPEAPETPPPALKAQKHSHDVPTDNRHDPEPSAEGDANCSAEDSDMETVEVDEANNRVAEASAPSSTEQLRNMSAEDECAMYHGRIRKLPRNRQEEVSKALTNLLRHSAERAGLKVATDGFVSPTELLKTRRFRRDRINVSEIVAAVAFNDKARFELAYQQREADYIQEGPPGKSLFVRAVQGHSIGAVDNAAALTKPDGRTMPKTAVHGTYWDLYHSILEQRLLAGGPRRCRRHIHLTTGLPKDRPLSGMRSSAEIGLWYDMVKAHRACINFFQSKHGVLLTEGRNGALSSGFIRCVQIVESGEIIKGENGPPTPQLVLDALLRSQGIAKHRPLPVRKAQHHPPPRSNTCPCVSCVAQAMMMPTGYPLSTYPPMSAGQRRTIKRGATGCRDM